MSCWGTFARYCIVFLHNFTKSALKNLPVWIQPRGTQRKINQTALFVGRLTVGALFSRMCEAFVPGLAICERCTSQLCTARVWSLKSHCWCQVSSTRGCGCQSKRLPTLWCHTRHMMPHGPNGGFVTASDALFALETCNLEQTRGSTGILKLVSTPFSDFWKTFQVKFETLLPFQAVIKQQHIFTFLNSLRLMQFAITSLEYNHKRDHRSAGKGQKKELHQRSNLLKF